MKSCSIIPINPLITLFKFIHASTANCGSFTANSGELSEAYIKSSWLNEQVNLEHDVLRAKALLLLNMLAGILDMAPLFYLPAFLYLSSSSQLITLVLFVIGSLIVWPRIVNGSEMTFGQLLTPFFHQEMKQENFQLVCGSTAGHTYVLLLIFMILFFY